MPERAILVIIDGLHTEAPARIEMPNFNRLAKNGTLIEETTVIMPYHPTHGEYAEVHTSSYPNPVMMTGSVFLEADQDMLQHSMETSAFVANTYAYQSITPGYEYVVQKSEPDQFAIDQATRILENNTIDFMRIHMQDAGGAGYQSFSADDDVPYKYNIWHEESPYRKALRNADQLLGQLVEELKAMGKWEGTLLVVTSDHGQTKTGWHPTLPEESWLLPTVFHGPGIAQNRTIERADMIDLVPTIAHLMDVQAPNTGGGSGRILEAVQASNSNPPATYDSRLFALNQVLADYIRNEAAMMSRADKYPQLNSRMIILERDFYGLNRIMDWDDFDSIKALIDNNRKVVEQMNQALADVE